MYVVVSVTSVGCTYEIKINENKTVNTIIGEVIEAVCREQQLEMGGKASDYLLMNKSSKKLLTGYQTMIQSGVRDGDRLILV